MATPKARHFTLYKVAERFGWGWGLTSEIGKAHAYELTHKGELYKTSASSVARMLFGADKLASAFGITPKGLDVLIKYFFDKEKSPSDPVHKLLTRFFDMAFSPKGAEFLMRIKSRTRK